MPEPEFISLGDIETTPDIAELGQAVRA